MNTPELRIFECRLIESRLTLEQQAHPSDKMRRDHPSAETAWNLEKLWRRVAVLQAREIDVALLKIHRGKFGICERCGRPMSPKRLDAIPWARQCFPCHSGQAQKTFAASAFRAACWRWRLLS